MFFYLALQELEALLVQDFDKLGLKVLVAVPGPAGHRAVWLQVVQHVHLLLRRLHTTNMNCETAKLVSPQDGQQRRSSHTHSHRFDGFDEFLALQVLQDLVDLRQRQVALEADVSAPDPCSTGRHFSNTSLLLRHSNRFPLFTLEFFTNCFQWRQVLLKKDVLRFICRQNPRV